MPMQVELVSPERILFSGEAERVIARTIGEGELAFLPNHAPFLGALDVSTVRIKPVGGPEIVAEITGGFVEVRDNRVIILSEETDLSAGTEH